jgi:hypothetical protein
MALLYYRGSVILAHFEIIPILAYINLTDPSPAHLTGGLCPLTSAPIPQKIWPLTASIGMIGPLWYTSFSLNSEILFLPLLNF